MMNRNRTAKTRVEFADAHVVICDDSITNVMILSKLIQEEGIGRVQTFTDPRKAIPYLQEHTGAVELLILDLEMPHLSGFDVMAALQPPDTDQEAGFNYPILVITGLTDKETRHRALGAGATDFLNKPFDPVEVTLRVRNLLRVEQAFRLQANLAQQMEIEVERRTAELIEAVDSLLHRLAMAAELRDNETGLHVIRVGRYSRLVAEAIGLPDELCQMIEKAAPLHDIGKIGIPDQILHKPGSLDQTERELMTTHSEKGAQLLGEHDSLLIQMAASIAIGHHEKWDGTGYPYGIAGESIPIEARIVALSDVFDALASVRPYKNAWPTDEIFTFIQERSGSHFDPKVAAAFIENREQILAIWNELQD